MTSKNVFALALALAIICALCPPALAAGDITWGGLWSSKMINSTALIVSGAYGIRVNITGITPIDRIDFYLDGKYFSSDYYAPYYYHWDNGKVPNALYLPYPKKYTVEGRAYSKGVNVRTERLEIIPASNLNMLRNPNLTTTLKYWGSHGSYASWTGSGKNDPGALHFTPNYGGVTEAWNERIIVHPGDKIIYEGWFKAGDAGVKRTNNGAGLGWDLRLPGTETIFYTMNGPATMNKNWTKIRTEYTLPCYPLKDASYTTWSVSSGSSSTPSGARVGLRSTSYSMLSAPMPKDIALTPWVHIWLMDTLKSADIDTMSLVVVPKAITC